MPNNITIAKDFAAGISSNLNKGGTWISDLDALPKGRERKLILKLYSRWFTSVTVEHGVITCVK